MSVFASVVSGLALSLSFPRWSLFPVAWFALVPLLWACGRARRRDAFLLGWLSGMAFFSTTLHWVTISMSLYGKLPWPASYALMLLLSSYLALFFGLFALGFSAWTRRFSLAGPLSAPFLWVALEMLRGRLFSGFPWALLGYSQYRFLQIIQISDAMGVYGVSFLLVLSNVAIWSIVTRRPAAVALAAVFLVGLGGTWGYGQMRLSQTMIDPERTISVGIVQGNISMDQKWDEKFRGETLKIYGRLSHQIAGSLPTPALLVWPESAVPFVYELDPPDREEVVRVSRTERDYLLFGSPAVTFLKQGAPLLHNSAYLLSPQGSILARYDKIHLVPFGEYVPLSGLIWFVNKMVEGIGDFQSGRDYTLMSVDGTSFGTVVCFEVIFPELVREFVDRGATFMATLTNDAWFGDSGAPYQHFSMAAFRSVENRVSFIRSANTGISGFIDPHGRILAASPLFKEAVLSGSVHPGIYRTFYTAHGDFFGWGCVIIVFATAIATGAPGPIPTRLPRKKKERE